MGELRFDPIEHVYSLDGIILPSVTQALKASGLIDYSFIAPDVLEAAAQRGSRVHRILELLDREQLDEASIDPRLIGYIEACRSWYRDTGFIVSDIERRVLDEIHGYAGRLDRTGMIQGYADRWAVVDFKTGIVLPGHRLQVTGYTLGLPNPRMYERINLELHADGTYQTHTYDSDTFNEDAQVFYAAVSVARWRMAHERGFKIWKQ